MWEVFYGAGALILGAVIAGTLFWNRGRSKRKEEVAEEATHEMYKHPVAYEDHERAELQREAEQISEDDKTKTGAP